VSLVETPRGVRLVQAPVAEVEALRREVVADVVDQPVNGVYPLGAGGDALDVELEVLPGTAPEVQVHVLVAGEASTVVGLRAADGVAYVDRTASGATAFHPRFAGRYEAPLDGEASTTTLRVLVDRGSVEVFVDGKALTALVFPPEGAAGLALVVPQGEARIVGLRAWRMASAFEVEDGE